VPFELALARPLTASGIREFAPAHAGVYGLSNSREWVYIGEADNLRESLLRHVGERDTDCGKRVPTGFVYEICARASRWDRQNRLVLEYEPVCNRHWSPGR
jgi:hypothetical protein